MSLSMNDDLAAALDRANAAPLPTFKASRSSECGSGYVCPGIEVGDRIVQLPGRDGPIVLCEGCAGRLEAAASLANVTPLRATDPPVPAAPQSVAEAESALADEWAAFRQYRPETVRALLALLGDAAERVAADERRTWSTRLRSIAGRSHGAEFRAGIAHAAHLIHQNRRTPL